MATRAQIIPNAYTQIRCETFNCAENAVWSLGAPDGPLGTQFRLCEADARSLIETLPDGLLPAVLVLIRRHVEAGTDFAKELATLLGGPALVPAPKAEPVMDQNAIGEYVLAQVAQETPWGMDLLAKITQALPDEEPKAGPSATESSAGAPRTITEAHKQALTYVATQTVEGSKDDAASPTIAQAHKQALTYIATLPEGAELPTGEEGRKGLACVCGWTPKDGSANPDRDLKAHQRQCRVFKEQKGEG